MHSYCRILCYAGQFQTWPSLFIARDFVRQKVPFFARTTCMQHGASSFFLLSVHIIMMKHRVLAQHKDLTILTSSCVDWNFKASSWKCHSSCNCVVFIIERVRTFQLPQYKRPCSILFAECIARKEAEFRCLLWLQQGHNLKMSTLSKESCGIKLHSQTSEVCQL